MASQHEREAAALRDRMQSLIEMAANTQNRMQQIVEEMAEVQKRINVTEQKTLTPKIATMRTTRPLWDLYNGKVKLNTDPLTMGKVFPNLINAECSKYTHTELLQRWGKDKIKHVHYGILLSDREYQQHHARVPKQMEDKYVKLSALTSDGVQLYALKWWSESGRTSLEDGNFVQLRGTARNYGYRIDKAH